MHLLKLLLVVQEATMFRLHTLFSYTLHHIASAFLRTKYRRKSSTRLPTQVVLMPRIIECSNLSGSSLDLLKILGALKKAVEKSIRTVSSCPVKNQCENKLELKMRLFIVFRDVEVSA